MVLLFAAEKFPSPLVLHIPSSPFDTVAVNVIVPSSHTAVSLGIVTVTGVNTLISTAVLAPVQPLSVAST